MERIKKEKRVEKKVRERLRNRLKCQGGERRKKKGEGTSLKPRITFTQRPRMRWRERKTGEERKRGRKIEKRSKGAKEEKK